MDQRKRGSRGATSIFFVFLVIAVITVGAMVIAFLSVANLRGARDVVATTQALYAADTGIELGRTHAEWDVDLDGDGNLCTILNDAPVSGITGTVARLTDTAFDLVVTGDPRPQDPFPEPNDTLDDNCPKADELTASSPTRALCMTAIGHVRSGLVRRRIDSDTDPARCIGDGGQGGVQGGTGGGQSGGGPPGPGPEPGGGAPSGAGPGGGTPAGGGAGGTLSCDLGPCNPPDATNPTGCSPYGATFCDPSGNQCRPLSCGCQAPPPGQTCTESDLFSCGGSSGFRCEQVDPNNPTKYCVPAYCPKPLPDGRTCLSQGRCVGGACTAPGTVCTGSPTDECVYQECLDSGRE